MNVALRKKLQQQPLIITTVLVSINFFVHKARIQNTWGNPLQFQVSSIHLFLQSPPYVMEDLTNVDLDGESNLSKTHQKKVNEY